MILGGGISGLYTAYQLLKRQPDRHLVILDKRDRWGGRIHTYKDANMTVETGAARFNDRHPLLLDLIHELHLEKLFQHQIVPKSHSRSRSPLSRPCR